MGTSAAACPSGDERVVLFGLLLDTNARLAREVGHDLEEHCAIPLAWFEVLLQLRRAPEGRLTMRQIADATVHSTGGTTRLIDRVEASGFVVREHCPNDRRTTHVRITAAGNVKLNDALARHVHHLDAHFSARLNCDERAALAALLTKLQ